jgi:hypothetical protein
MPISRISAKVILVGRAGAMMPPLFAPMGQEMDWVQPRQLGTLVFSSSLSIGPFLVVRQCKILIWLAFPVTRGLRAVR